MPRVRFTQQTMPQSGEELKQVLREALENAAPLSDFIQVVRELTQLELHYVMGSEEFFVRFERGELGDDVDFVRWAIKYEIYQETETEEVLREIDGILYATH